MKKKHIYILATGGTISAQGEEGKTLNYTNGIFKISSKLDGYVSLIILINISSLELK